MGAWIVLSAALPTAAGAQSGPLLSGYGGPGQGNQVILGSTLLGGPGGGSSGGSSGPSGLAVAASGSPGVATAAHAGAGTNAGILRSTHAGATAVGARRAGAAARASTPAPYPAVEPAAATSPALGLSGTDVLYITLAAVALGLTGLLTRRMVRAGPGQEPH